MDIKDAPAEDTLSAKEAVKLADAIKRIDKAFKDLDNSGLNRKAIVTLVSEYSGVGKRDINAVLDSLNALADTYLEKSKT